jgi:succinate dehydrogenase/fumarate reductase flavoprotein subunit
MVDVIVLGSGAAGLVAALAASEAGASVGVYEKADLIGGTSALSGGICWIPDNPHLHAAGLSDSRDEALAYLGALSLGAIDRSLAETLIDSGPPLVDWLEATTPLRLAVARGYPDYHPEHPGGKPGGGRSLDPCLFEFDSLGEWAHRVARPMNVPRMTLVESPLGGGTGIIDPAVAEQRRGRDARGRGQALVGALLKACLDRGIEPVTQARAVELLTVDGRIRGARFDIDGEPVDVRANRGVIIATGGFEWNPELVRAFLRGPMTSPTGVPTNTGDGLMMAMSVGASLGMMSEAWWVPTAMIPGLELFDRPWPQLILRERTLPRSIMVNRRGKRFTNEAANYNALGGAFHQFDPTRFDYANLPCWLIFDDEYLRLYGFAGSPPGSPAPAWLTRAGSLDELARAIGVAPEGLVATVDRWNDHVAEGFDPDFGRGDSAYDGWSGDQRYLGTREATLGPVHQPPFYAIEIASGSLGTKGGPRTNGDAQVLNHAGIPIPGLYAAGNAMAAATGMVYGGAGGTLGPAMVFGYRAGRHAAATPVAGG